MRIPFATFEFMHKEIRPDLDHAYKSVMDRGWFIQGSE